MMEANNRERTKDVKRLMAFLEKPGCPQQKMEA
jgi:hypothetical protein